MIITEFMENGSLDTFLKVSLKEIIGLINLECILC